MAKWKPKRGSSFENKQGRAKVVYSAEKNQMLVHFHPENKNEKIADKKFVVSEWPDFVKPDTVSNFEWLVRLGKDKIYSMYPYKLKELVTFQVDGIASGQDKPPTPKEITGQYGSYFIFTTLLRIVDGPDGTVGAIVPYTLHYVVALDDETGYIRLTGFGKNGVWGPRLDHFWDITGVWDFGPIKYKDNILPEVQKKQLHATKQIIGQIKDGYIVQDSLDVAGEEWDNDSDAALWDGATEVDETPEPSFETTEWDETENPYTPEVESDDAGFLDDWDN